MIINFKEMNEAIIPAFKGGEKEFAVKMFDDESNKIMSGRLIPGASIGLHTHEGNCEIIYILEGCGKVLYDGTEQSISAGMCHYCPEGHSHSLINDSDKELLFFAVVPSK